MSVINKIKTEKVFAIPCKQNDREFFVSKLRASILGQICFVARRDENPIDGFQRTLNKSRAQNIEKYLLYDKGCIPSALILSAKPEANLKCCENEIEFDLRASSFMVLDGQHRLFGLLLALEEKYDIEIPVVIFKSLSVQDEVQLFIDINTTQKGVPTTLLLDIKNLSGKETSMEEKQRIVFDKLNKGSVLKGLMSPTKSKVGYIARTVFNEATTNALSVGFLVDQDADTIYRVFKNYLEAVEFVFVESKSPKAKLTNSNLFKAVFSIFNDCVDLSFRRFNNLKVESLRQILEPIASIRFDEYIGTNKVTYNKILSDMKNEINRYSARISSDSIDGLL